MVHNPLAVSNIAWNSEESQDIATIMQNHGVFALEVAPGKLFDTPLNASPEDVQSIIKFWALYDIKIVAMQGLLYGQNNLTLFGDRTETIAFQAYMKSMIQLASMLKIGPLVYGAPRTRQPGMITFDQAKERAAEVFYPLAEYAFERGCSISFEPNSSAYGCNFGTCLQQVISLVEEINHPGFGLQIDTGNFSMENDDYNILDQAIPLCHHFHLSAPHLSNLEKNDNVRFRLLQAALNGSYCGHISIEISTSAAGGNALAIDNVLRMIKAETRLATCPS